MYDHRKRIVDSLSSEVGKEMVGKPCTGERRGDGRERRGGTKIK
jgi:hypothetical protein